MIILLESLPTVERCVALLATDLTHRPGALFTTSIPRAIPLLLIVVVAATIAAVVIVVIGAPVVAAVIVVPALLIAASIAWLVSIATRPPPRPS
jgi:hypothetical protein